MAHDHHDGAADQGQTIEMIVVWGQNSRRAAIAPSGVGQIAKEILTRRMTLRRTEEMAGVGTADGETVQMG